MQPCLSLITLAHIEVFGHMSFFYSEFSSDKVIPPNSGVTLPQVIWNICAAHSDLKTEKFAICLKASFTCLVIGFLISG